MPSSTCICLLLPIAPIDSTGYRRWGDEPPVCPHRQASQTRSLATNKLVDVFDSPTSKFIARDCTWEEALARSKSATLTEAELRIMNVLWDRGSATVHEVLEALPAKPALAYNSVLTIIRILEKKGYAKHVKDQRAHVYLPQVDRKDATRFEVRHLVSRFFGNSREQLVLNVLEETGIDAEELDRVRQLLERSK
jgi:BlaI family transcriptional regulator, penicillinase repressor